MGQRYNAEVTFVTGVPAARARPSSRSPYWPLSDGWIPETLVEPNHRRDHIRYRV